MLDKRAEGGRNDRMTVIKGIDPFTEQLREWLEGTVDGAQSIIADDGSERLESQPVNSYVNNARNDGERWIEPIAS